MRIPLRAARRLAVTGCSALAGLLLVVAQGRAATPPEKILPDSTVAFVKINNAAGLREAFRQSQFGQLWNDPAVKVWKDDIIERVEDASKTLKEKIGVTYLELFELPQGPTAIAFLKHENPQIPIVLLVIADAGKNTGTMNDVLTKATKQGASNGAKVSTETFKGVTIHVIQPPKEKEEAGKDKDKAKDDKPEPPIVWSSQGSIFYISSDVEAMKDLIAHEQGRSDSLAATESFGTAIKKLSSDAQVLWYVELPKFLKLMAQSGVAGNANNNGNADNPNQAQQAEAMIQVTGLNGLKAATGSFTLNAGNYDSLTKAHILEQGPPQGLVKVFRMPKIAMQPEPWVPASVASYQSISWDLDQAYLALNDLANLFQPGVLQVLEQQLVGPNGGEPLRFKQDIFDPLGDRITIVSDFKKPVKEDSERMLLAVSLEDSKALQNSLNKLISLTGGQPKKREFQGTTIYDFEVPDMPNPNAAAAAPRPGIDDNLKPRGPISVAIAKETLFVSSEPTLLEQVLRGGGPSLADSAAYRAVARELPEKVSSMTYVRPDEQARITYDMIKSGQFEKALQGAAVAGGPDLSRFAKLIDKEKMPDFSVFAKYLSQGGRYSEMNDDGVSITGFTLRKAKP